MKKTEDLLDFIVSIEPPMIDPIWAILHPRECRELEQRREMNRKKRLMKKPKRPRC